MSLQYFLKETKEREKKSHSLPILHIPIPLRQLRPEIDKVAPKQQIVLRRDGEGVAHEGPRVDDQGARHAAGYTNVIFQQIYIVYRDPVALGVC